MRLPILAALSVCCVEEGGTPRVAAGVQYGDEGLKICDEGLVEPWDVDVAPDAFVEAPSVTRDRALGAWTAEAVRSGDASTFVVAVDIAAAEGPTEFLDLGPDDNIYCAGIVRTPITLSITSDVLSATFQGVMGISVVVWDLRTAVDGLEVDGTLLPTGPASLEGLTLRFEAVGYDPGLQGTGPLGGYLRFTETDEAPTETFGPGPDPWSRITMERQVLARTRSGTTP